MGRLWIRWAWRDLMARRLQVGSTALILAIGLAAFWGIGGIREWRERSTDLSLRQMRAHDLRVDLSEDGRAEEGQLRAAVAGLPDGMVAAAEERLVAPGQIDASRPGKPVLLPAQLVGIPLRGGGQRVDRLEVLSGRGLSTDDGTRAVGVLDWNFANHFDLPPSGRVRLAGSGELRYVGQGVTPQHLLVVDQSGLSGAQSKLGILYLPLAAAQRFSGRPGAVNELLVRLGPNQSADRAERAVRSALRAALPRAAITVTRGDEEAAPRILYRDARNDQKIFLTLAALVLAGAGFATFNLISRVVEAQRREIGVGMAIGVEPRLLALRPFALALQVGVLGALLALPVGVALSAWIKTLLKDFFPLPIYAQAFPIELFLIGSTTGVAIPLVAAAIPVRRAVAMAPIDAIRIGFRAAKGAGATRLVRGLPIPGRSLARLPLRNVARAPGRTLLTVLALAAVITAIVAVLGMVDSIRDTADRQEAEVLRSSPDRLEVQLAALEPADGPLMHRLSSAPGVAAWEPVLTVASEVSSPKASIGTALSLVSARSPIWRPTLIEGHGGGRGILLAERAADDLGVRPGDSVLLRHPRRVAGGLVAERVRVRVAGVHANPVRALAYMDAAQAPDLGLGGIANGISLVPEAGRADDLERALFGEPGVASVRPASSDTDALRTTVDAFGESIQIVAFITLGLGILVAFTTVSVSVDERRREYATMFAFGFPPRSGLRVTMVESLIIGLLGTAMGIVLGLGVIRWIVHSLLPDTFPDLGAEMALTGASVAVTLIVGIAAVTVAPLFTFHRLRRMDIPSTLRVVE